MIQLPPVCSPEVSLAASSSFSPCNKKDKPTWVFPLHGKGALVLNPKCLRDLTPGLLLQAAQPILRATSSPRLFGHCSQGRRVAQYTRTSGSSRLSTSSIHLGASTSVPPVARQQVGWAHHIHPCCLYMVWRYYTCPTSNLWDLAVTVSHSGWAPLYHL